MAASALSGPILFNPDSDGKGAPFAGMPLMPAVMEMGVDGITGVSGYFNHFFRWEGPVSNVQSEITGSDKIGGWLMTFVDGDDDDLATAGINVTDRGGSLDIVTDDKSGDNTHLELLGAPYRYLVGKRMWFGIRFGLSDFDLAAVRVGLFSPATADIIAAVVDAIMFEKASTDTKMTFSVRKDSTSTSKANIDTIAMVDTTMHAYEFFVDVSGNLHAYYDGVEVAAGLIAAGDANIPGDEQLALGVEFQTGGAAHLTGSVDWLYCYQEI